MVRGRIFVELQLQQLCIHVTMTRVHFTQGPHRHGLCYFSAIMGKNKGKGGKNRRRGKNDSVVKRELVTKEEGQDYAQVLRMLGNGRLEAHCFDGQKRLCHIRGKMRKRVWVNQGDIILVGLRDFQDSKADVILKYNTDEARQLKKMGELPDHVNITEDMLGDEGGDDVIFASDDSDAGSASDSDSDDDRDVKVDDI